MTDTKPAARVVADSLPALRRYAVRLASGHPEDADDLVQITVERALRLDWEGAAIRQPQAYLIRMMRNVHFDRLRRTQRESVVDGDLDAVPVEGNQDLALICGETLKEIEAMPAPTRALMRMAAAGESYRDIARTLGVPVGTVTSRLARARDDLARKVGWSRGVAA